jgi:hypothetical protein
MVGGAQRPGNAECACMPNAAASASRFHFRGDGCFVGDGGNELERLYRLARWKPIKKCDGRFVCPGNAVTTTEERKLSLSALSLRRLCEVWFVCASMPVLRVADATMGRDAVDVIRLRGGGGLLTYAKSDSDAFIHTLNTESGLCRKLLALRDGLCYECVRCSLLDVDTQALFGALGALLSRIPEEERTQAAPAIAVALRAALARAATPSTTRATMPVQDST